MHVIVCVVFGVTLCVVPFPQKTVTMSASADTTCTSIDPPSQIVVSPPIMFIDPEGPST